MHVEFWWGNRLKNSKWTEKESVRWIWGTCNGNGRQEELAQDRVQWQNLVLAVVNLRILLPED